MLPVLYRSCCCEVSAPPHKHVHQQDTSNQKICNANSLLVHMHTQVTSSSTDSRIHSGIEQPHGAEGGGPFHHLCWKTGSPLSTA